VRRRPCQPERRPLDAAPRSLRLARARSFSSSRISRILRGDRHLRSPGATARRRRNWSFGVPRLRRNHHRHTANTRQPGAGTLPATLSNQSSSGAARTLLLPLWRALVPGRGPVVGTHKRPFTARSRSSAGCAFRDAMSLNFPRGHGRQGTRAVQRAG